MDLNNSYKKKGMMQEFSGSCLGKIIITSVILFFLFLLCVFTLPSQKVMELEVEDNVRQCLQENDSLRGDVIDEVVANISRSFSEADSTVDDHEIMDVYHKYNRVEFKDHTFFRTANIINYTHPEGVCVAWGIMGAVFSTVYYDDLVLTTGAVRRTYNKKLLQDPTFSDEDLGENPNLQPYHYEGNPDN